MSRCPCGKKLTEEEILLNPDMYCMECIRASSEESFTPYKTVNYNYLQIDNYDDEDSWR